jgi:hypothetical protein
MQLLHIPLLLSRACFRRASSPRKEPEADGEMQVRIHPSGWADSGVREPKDRLLTALPVEAAMIVVLRRFAQLCLIPVATDR